MRTAIIGGSFNPPHIGHLQLAEEVRYLGYERIFFIPSYISPHKRDAERPGSDFRLEMTRIAAEEAEVSVEDCEIKRKGVSYTIDTVKYLQENYNIEDKPGVVIGDDLLTGFHTWKDADTLSAITDILVAKRLFEEHPDFNYPHKQIKNIRLEVSSTVIRERIRSKKPYRFLVPFGVFRYIEENRLYIQSRKKYRINT